MTEHNKRLLNNNNDDDGEAIYQKESVSFTKTSIKKHIPPESQFTVG